MRFRKGMIIPVSVLLFFVVAMALAGSLRSFDDLDKISGTLSRIDSVDVKKRRPWFGSDFYRQYYLSTDAGVFKTTKKVVNSLRRGDQLIVYTRQANEPFSAVLPDVNIILHLEHNNNILIDFREEKKRWYEAAAIIILFSGFMVYLMRKRLREDRADGVPDSQNRKSNCPGIRLKLKGS